VVRLVCVRVWGGGILSCTSNQTIWRDLYISKPRANFNGCYISKVVFILLKGGIAKNEKNCKRNINLKIHNQKYYEIST